MLKIYFLINLIKTNIKKTIKYAIAIKPNIIEENAKISSANSFPETKYNKKEIIKKIPKNNNLLRTKLNFLSLTLIVLNNFLLELFLPLVEIFFEDFPGYTLCVTLFFFIILRLIKNTL